MGHQKRGVLMDTKHSGHFVWSILVLFCSGQTVIFHTLAKYPSSRPFLPGLDLGLDLEPDLELDLVSDLFGAGFWSWI
jgi:hypothetical protein